MAGGELRRQLLRHRFAFGVVGGEQLDPVGGGVRTEAENDRTGGVSLDLPQDQVGRPQ